MIRILILKTAALGDVLRTTSILPGLAERYAPCHVTWVTAPGALDLIARHPLVDDVITFDTESRTDLARVQAAVATRRWDLVLSLDDEEALCVLAAAADTARLSGAYLAPDGTRCYTDDVEPWFGMGLLARDGKAAADRRKIENRRSHPEIFAAMLGVAMGRPELPLDDELLERAARRLRGGHGPAIGLNTAAAGRWRTKALPEPRVVELVAELERRLDRPRFVLFGGPEEAERNARLRRAIGALPGAPDLLDTGTANSLLEFAALVSACDVLVSSDSLGMHVAIARRVPVVAFFAPTSAAEIELYGLGAKVVSTAADYCSYAPDADNSTITAGRLAGAVVDVLRLTEQ